jgi:hypothetical protein
MFRITHCRNPLQPSVPVKSNSVGYLARLSETDLILANREAPSSGPQKFQAATPRLRAIKLLSRMRGGSQSRLMLGDDNNLWIVKFQNNPQHLRILANELIGTQIAQVLGLSVPRCGIVDVSQTVIEAHPPMYMDRGPNRRELCLSGLQFGSQFTGGMISRRTEEYLSDEQLVTADNLEQFAGILAFDKWTCNTDYRQVTYQRHETTRGHSAVFIDQGACFNFGEWNFPDAPLKGVFAQTSAYSAVFGWESFEPWLSRIESFEPQALWEIAKGIPEEWYESKSCELEMLVEKMNARRSRVRELITQFKNSDKLPFPNWKSAQSASGRGYSHQYIAKMDAAHMGSKPGLSICVVNSNRTNN